MSNMKVSLLVTALSVAGLGAAMVYSGSPVQAEPVAKVAAPEVQRMEVGVVTTSSALEQAVVISSSEVRARNELSLTAEVTGRIQSLTPEFDSGTKVEKGTVLVQVDDVSYRKNLATAKTALANANVSLLEAKREANQAEKEWKLSGLQGEPDSPLVLKQPQLAAAQASYDEALATVTSAQRDLDNTRVVVPFDAYIISRNVSEGSVIQSGAVLGEIYSLDQVEVTLPLSARQWQLLPEDTSSIKVSLKDQETGYIWQATVSRIEQHMNSENRQRSLVVSVSQPFSQQQVLYPGSFVTATVSGKSLDNVMAIPASALTSKKQIWTVNDNGQLSSESVDVAFYRGDMAYVFNDTDKARQVVVRPLNSFSNGQKVLAVPEFGQSELLSAGVSQ